jgi:cyclopropane-fatty-acyl-phospholipid synthase
MIQTITGRPALQPTLAILNRLCNGYGARDFTLRFWDGTILEPDPGQPSRFTLAFQHPGALRQMIWPFNKANVGESYIYGDIDIDGNIHDFLALMRYWARLESSLSLIQKLGFLRQVLALPNEARPRPTRYARLSGAQRTAERDRQAIEYHYDGPPSEFYALFLGRFMQYSCAYFSDPGDSIDIAQEHKLDYICRKLQLKPGERLIDFGCGWGGLITFAAKNYGVHAVGVSVSKNQIEWYNRKIGDLGLGSCCRVEYMDYRAVPESEPFDKAVSVGFVEHVGDKMMPVFFSKVYKLLRPGGLYLNHGMTRRPFSPLPPWRAFGLKYVFPDGELLSIARTLEHLTRAGFEVRDVENLREHYMHTARCWLQGLEGARAEAVRLTDEVTYRIYRLFFAGAVYGFRSGIYHLNQTLVIKSGDDVSGLPLTRAAWYR